MGENYFNSIKAYMDEILNSNISLTTTETANKLAEHIREQTDHRVTDERMAPNPLDEFQFDFDSVRTLSSRNLRVDVSDQDQDRSVSDTMQGWSRLNKTRKSAEIEASNEFSILGVLIKNRNHRI